MIKRTAEGALRNLAKQFKAVAVVGPRQSGKTTLVRHIFDSKPYVSLENPDDRLFAQTDPRGFLAQYPDGAILDEAQRVPELFSYLQQILDESHGTGKFIITGSNNFLLQERISQSLAGRIAYLVLLPFTGQELPETETSDVHRFMVKGAYPPVYDQPVEPALWYANYIRTYIERDVRQVKNITDLLAFERFIRLCAGRIGQLLNMSSLAVETGVDSKTIGTWLGVLEAGFVLYRLQPYHKNFNKRVVKMPKLYFYDTGLACSLLGIQDKQQLLYHPLAGSLFENLVVGELLKHRFNRALPGNLYFWRDSKGYEIDVIVENGPVLHPLEVKAGQTITNEYFKNLLYWQELTGTREATVLYAGTAAQHRSNGISVLPWLHASSVASGSD